MEIPHHPPMPTGRFPIVILGAGGIVRDAHLPAYRLAGFEVYGISNRTRSRAEELAAAFDIPNVHGSVGEAVAAAPADAIFDLALPPSHFEEALEALPDGAFVLIQKPMGETFEQARVILDVCRRKGLRAAVNCQLRYAPYVLAARHLIAEGFLGELLDMEMRLTVYTPWHLFPFVEGLPRLEISYHSVHYIDLVRSFFGDPRSVHARTLTHPENAGLASVRSAILMDYPDPVRATITTNHCHHFGAKHQESYLKWEGTRGAIRARVGLLMDYPNGAGDCFEICELEDGEPGEWKEIPLGGSWFPHAFIGTMAQMMRAKEGSEPEMPTSVEDVIHTMACVEAAYESDRRGGVRPEEFLQ